MLNRPKLMDWFRRVGISPPLSGNYVAEDGTTNYVAEDGTSPYVTET